MEQSGGGHRARVRGQEGVGDGETGEEYEVVGKLLPLAPTESNLPWSVENLRICGCSLKQLAPKDVVDCPTCGRRLPALEG